MLRQAELLPLPDVGGSGQGGHEQMHGQRPAQAEAAVGLRVLGADPVGPARGVGHAEPGRRPDDVVVGQHPGGRRPDGVHGRQRVRDDLAQAIPVPSAFQEFEVERLAHLVGTDVGGQFGGGGEPRLGDEHPVGPELVEDRPPLPVDTVDRADVPHRRRRGVRGVAADHGDPVLPVGQCGVLGEPVGDVDSEAVDAAGEPEAQDVAELRSDLGVGPVEVRLRGVEEVKVPGGVVLPR